MRRVLVTGATGFVGNVLCGLLVRSGYIVRAAVRDGNSLTNGICEKIVVGDICGDTDWTSALTDVDYVIHAAARAHKLGDARKNEPLYFKTNVEGTRCLAEASACAGVRRFTFLSSIKVNGEKTTDQAFTSSDRPAPQDAYGESKWLAEVALFEIGSNSHMQMVIVRSPLVYGSAVRANFLRLLRWVDQERPLPLGSIVNNRSLISVWNLCDALVNVLQNPAAVDRAWMVTDGYDLSTPELIRQIGAAMGRRTRLIRVPVGALKILGTACGQKAAVARLCDSLQVDITATRRDLNWQPPMSFPVGLSRTVKWYLDTYRAAKRQSE